MARTNAFNAAETKARENFKQAINDRLLERGEEISKQLAEQFVEEARNNLISNSNPAPESIGLISRIANSITYKKTSEDNKKGYIVRIPMDREGLVMFLEYGTGLMGKNYSKIDSDFAHEANSIGWKYAIHENRYKTRKKTGKRGFIFTPTKGYYIDKDDEYIVEPSYEEQITKVLIKGYVRVSKKTGKVTTVKPYYRSQRKMVQKSTGKIISSGITPVRFIYKAKNSILNSLK